MIPFADLTMSTEAGAIVVALVGTLWVWSISAVSARVNDYHKCVMRMRSENATLRAENVRLWEQVQTLRHEVAVAKRTPPGAEPRP